MFGRSRNRAGPPPSRHSGMAPRLVALVALLFAVAAFILSILTLLGGYKPGFMPESNIVLLDTSNLGRELLPAARSIPAALLAERQLPDSVDELLDDAKDKLEEEADRAKDKLKDGANDAIGDIVDGVTEAIGVDKWYGLYAMTVCSGDYINGNDSSGGLNVRRCTEPLKELDVIEIIDLDLKVPGPIRAALDDMAQDAPKVFQAIGGIYIAGTALTGLLVLGAAAAVVLGASRLLSVLNLLIASLAAIALLAGGIVTTVAADKIAELVRDKAARVGLRAQVGGRFRGLSWAAFALAAVAALLCLFAAFAAFRSRSRRRRGHGSWEKGEAGSSPRGTSWEAGPPRRSAV